MNDRLSMAPVTRNRPPVRGTSQRIRLLVADDHALLRQALRVLLEAQDAGNRAAGRAGLLGTRSHHQPAGFPALTRRPSRRT